MPIAPVIRAYSGRAMMFPHLSFATSYTLWALVCPCFVGGAVAKSPVDFGRDVAPVFERHCIRCHQPSNKKGGLSLATATDLKSNEYIVAGEPDASYLSEVVTAAAGEKPLMPKEGLPLSAQEVSVLRDWIREGAL